MGNHTVQGNSPASKLVRYSRVLQYPAMSVADLPHVLKMSVDDWALIQDNPRQRDTKERAMKALKKHLKNPHPAHYVVEMGMLPDGSTYKFNGHTRSYLWQSGELEHPDDIIVLVYPLESQDQIREFYHAFDNQQAVETSNDKVFSAIRDAFGRAPRSSFFKTRGARVAIELVRNNGDSMSDDKLYSLNDDCPKLIDAMKIVDEYNQELPAVRFSASLRAAVLASVMRDGHKAIDFWVDYVTDAGTKQNGKVNAVEILARYVDDIRAYTDPDQRGIPDDVKVGIGREVHKWYFSRFLYLYDKWSDGNKEFRTRFSRWTSYVVPLDLEFELDEFLSMQKDLLSA